MLQVGAAKVCINATADMYPFPAKDCDWGIENYAPSEIYDDMDCRAIASESDFGKVIMLCYELGSVPDVPTLAEEIALATDFPKEHILIMATHNHTGARPAMGVLSPAEKTFHEKLLEIYRERGIRACRMAVENMRPAKYG